MNRTILFATFAGLALAFFSCKSGQNNKNQDTVIEEEEEFTPFEFESFQAKDSCRASVISIEIKIPKANGNEAAGKIHDKLLARLNDGKSTDKNTQDFIDDLLAMEKIELGTMFNDIFDPENPDFPPSLEYHTSISPSFAEQDILVFELGGYQYMGGAHGFPHRAFLCYNKTTGDQITLEDIFTNTSHIAQLLKTKAAKDFKKENGIAEDDSDIFYDESVKITENFTVDRKYIYFQYDPYELGPYCIGMPQLKLSKNDVKQYVIPDSPIYKLWFE